MSDLDEQLGRRDRFLRRRWAGLTAEQRVAEMMQLQETTWQLLRSSPEGYQHFLRRNFKARAIDVPAHPMPPDRPGESE
jgi:hypothetical protein